MDNESGVTTPLGSETPQGMLMGSPAGISMLNNRPMNKTFRLSKTNSVKISVNGDIPLDVQKYASETRN